VIDPAAAAERALGRSVRSASIDERSPIVYDPYLPGRAVDRIRGFAESSDGSRRPWSAVAKRTDGPGLRAARRELAAYRLGLTRPADDVPFRGPTLLTWHADAEHVEIWLEDLRDEHDGTWAVERFGVAARHIAAWVAAVRELSTPDDFDSEDAWAERHGQPTRLDEARAQLGAFRGAPNAEALADLLRDVGFRRTQALIESTPQRIEELAAFPQTLLHHDLVRSNLFALGERETVAIDWENVGRGPFGVELAPLVIGSVRRGEASGEDLAAIESAVLAEYVQALEGLGIGHGADVRAAYRLALGLRWHVVLGAIGSWLDPTSWGMRGSRRDEPREDALRHLVVLTRHILDAAVP
jgi:hypothetical protein